MQFQDCPATFYGYSSSQCAGNFLTSGAGDDWEEEAALSYARRRRLGPFRMPYDDSWERRQKDLAAMARAGFGFGLSKKILSQAPREGH